MVLRKEEKEELEEEKEELEEEKEKERRKKKHLQLKTLKNK